ncbi:MAG: hypothetical protein IPP72_20705 [Chitinophagaceae bacterium]|nr:hypothetical protein [Chitinophagaceae bacterium]
MNYCSTDKKYLSPFNNAGTSPVIKSFHFLLLSVVSIIFSCSNNDTGNAATGKKVEIRKEGGGYRLYKNAVPFLVKGAVGHTHISELAASGGNTMLIWDTSLIEKTLNEAEQYHVSIIVGLDIPTGELTDFYKDEKQVNKLFTAYEKIVKKYKNHPALLAWGLGNELIMPISSQSSYFYKTYNRFLKMIHTEDVNHPVTTTVINYQKQSLLNIRWKIRDLDFISINTYNRLKDMRSQLKKLSLFWDGPFMVSEWSPNGGWESETTVWQAPIENTSTKKAEKYRDFYRQYMPLDNSRFLGSLVFYWGNRQEYTHTWYSVFDESGTATEIKEALVDCWSGSDSKHQSAKLKYMLIDSMGARENIILSPGSIHTASILLADEQAQDSLRYSWEIVKEDWLHWGRTWHYFKRPEAERNLLADSTL